MSPDDDPGARYRPRESWVDRQIREATERGEFDDLPGAGKPIPDIRAPRDENAWVKSFLEREKVSMPLPESLQLRKDVAELQATLADVRREVHAREIVEALNDRIRQSHRRRPDGPPIHINPVDVDAALAEWRAARQERGLGTTD